MRYFTKELWWQVNDCDQAVRLQAEKQWKLNCQIYQQEFETVKKQLSRRFLKEFHCRNELHDYVIEGISVIKNRKKYSCEMKLTDGTETVVLILKELKAFQMNVDSFQHCIMGELAWGYSEFSLTEDGGIALSVLCDFQNEFHFQFRSITLSRISECNVRI